MAKALRSVQSLSKRPVCAPRLAAQSRVHLCLSAPPGRQCLLTADLRVEPQACRNPASHSVWEPVMASPPQLAQTGFRWPPWPPVATCARCSGAGPLLLSLPLPSLPSFSHHMLVLGLLHSSLCLSLFLNFLGHATQHVGSYLHDLGWTCAPVLEAESLFFFFCFFFF